MGVCNCSMFCCTLLYVHFSIAIILMGKRELIALLNLSAWCLVMVERLFLAVPRGCLQFVIVVFPDHTHLLFFRLDRRIGFQNTFYTKYIIVIIDSIGPSIILRSICHYIKLEQSKMQFCAMERRHYIVYILNYSYSLHA